jgi:hypothetical protein
MPGTSRARSRSSGCDAYGSHRFRFAAVMQRMNFPPGNGPRSPKQGGIAETRRNEWSAKNFLDEAEDSLDAIREECGPVSKPIRRF